MMTMALPVPTERLIYSLTNYTCDGTINTFIDTGIKLLGYEYDSFRIEMEYDGLDLSTTGQETLLECKSFIPISSGSPYTSGLVVRVNDRNQYSPQYEALNISFKPLRTTDAYFQNTSSANLSIVYNRHNNSITVNGETVEFSGSIYHNEPLTIGGRYTSHLSNPDRFVQFHISSLKIYATPSGFDPTYIYIPLTFKCLTGGDLSIKNANTSWDRNFEYSLNGGAWTAVDLPKNTASKFIATLSPNDTISFRRDNENFADALFISDSNLTFDIYGNLLSLQYGSAFSGQTELRNTSKTAFGSIFRETNVVDASKLMLTASTLSVSCYNQMFKHCTSLVSAPMILATTLGTDSCNRMFSECYNLVNVQSQLYATTLSTNCCYEMFNECQSLVNAPILPAVSLAKTCYKEMFRHCYSLATAPELPATTLAESCYQSMFESCGSLTAAPSLLATTLAKACYAQMFKDCTNLVSVQNELPATTLADSCYVQMFANCKNITRGPDLPALTTVTGCYVNMFNGCSKLNYIKCLNEGNSGTAYMSAWLYNVSSTGTFVKSANKNDWTRDYNGIPSNWTVVDAS